jgi:hypothetical protein
MKYKNAASASACFAPIKKKLLASAPLDGEGTPAPTATPKNGAKGKAKGGKKRVAEEAELDDEEGDGEEILKTKGKKTKASEDEDGEAEAEIKGEASDVD